MLSPMKLISRQSQRDESAEVKWAAALVDAVGRFGRIITDGDPIPWIEVRGDLFNAKKLCTCLGVGSISTQVLGRAKLTLWRVEGVDATAVIRLIYPFMESQRLVAQFIDPSRPNPSLMTIRVVGWRQRVRSIWVALKRRFRRA